MKKSDGLRIAILNHNVKEVGTYYRCFGFAKGLARKRHMVYFFYLSPQRHIWPRKKMHDNLTSIELPWRSGGGITGAIEHSLRGIYIFLFILFRKIDIVHSFNVPSPMIALATLLIFFVKGIKKIKLVIDWDDIWGKGGLTELNRHKHGKIQRVIANMLETKIPLLADRLTLHNDFIAQKAQECGVDRKIITKLYNGSNTDAFKLFYSIGYAKKDARKELGLPQNKSILFFGSAVVTSVPFLLDVIEKIKNENILLLVIGPIEKKFIEILNKKDLNDKVLFKGLVDYEKYKKYLFASDLLLLPRSNSSLLDRCTFPGRLGDFMLSGRPIIASDVGELSKIFREDDIGMLADPDDVDDFAEKILCLIDNNELQETLGKNALKIGKNKYEWDILTATLINKVYLD